MIEENRPLHVADGRTLRLCPDVFVAQPDHLVVVHGRAVHCSALASSGILTAPAADQLVAAGAAREVVDSAHPSTSYLPPDNHPVVEVRYGAACASKEPSPPRATRVVVLDVTAPSGWGPHVGAALVVYGDPDSPPVVAGSAYAISSCWAGQGQDPFPLLRLLRQLLRCTDTGTSLILDRAISRGDA